jgi:hypothetical protein
LANHVDDSTDPVAAAELLEELGSAEEVGDTDRAFELRRKLEALYGKSAEEEMSRP